MNRSGYSDDYDGWDLIRYRGAVNSAIRGKRGQQLLRELADALDAMPNRRLIAGELEADGEYCALGIVGCKRGLAMAGIDAYDSKEVAKTFNVAEALAREIMFVNDEWLRHGTAEQRWSTVREWVRTHIIGGQPT